MGNETSADGGNELGGDSNEYGGTFNEAFASAHKDLGAGNAFTWNGNEYTTDRADGRDLKAEAEATSHHYANNDDNGWGWNNDNDECDYDNYDYPQIQVPTFEFKPIQIKPLTINFERNSKNCDVIESIKSNAKDSSSGKCGAAVRKAVQASGKSWKQPKTSYVNGKWEVCAKDFGPSLEAAGYKSVIYIGGWEKDAEKYESELEAGDILIFEGVGTKHPYGHAQIYVGDDYKTTKYGKKTTIKYISDFKQYKMNPWIDGKHAGITVYRLK